MPINSSSIPALRIARKLRRKKRASGGGIFDYSGVSEALPEASIKDHIPEPLAIMAKSMVYDLPRRAIDAAKNTTYGLRREDFTDIPHDYSPDQSKAIYNWGLRLPKGAWSPVDDMIGASLETGMNVMGGTALSAPAKAAGEFVAGAGPRVPEMWHGISKVKLPKPVAEMSAVHTPAASFAERFVDPASMQGGKLLPLVGDRTGVGTRLTQVNGYKFENPVDMQGGHGFIPANADTGAAWASGKSVTNRLGNVVRAEAAGDQPLYGVYTAMGERSADFSHHVSDTLAEMFKHVKTPKAARMSFDDEMRAISPDWPGVNSQGLRQYLNESPGAVRAQFAKLMGTAKYQSAGFPSVAEARFAVTDPRLLNVETGASGASIARLDPSGRTFQTPGQQHLSYDTNLAGTYHGGLSTSIPKEVMYPDIMRHLEQYRDKLPGYKPTTDYLMTRTPKGLPLTQQADQKWVDGVSSYLESKGFRLGAGANDRRAATLAVVDDVLAAEKGFGKVEKVPVDSLRPRPENTAMIEKFKKRDADSQAAFEAAYPGEKYTPYPGDSRYKVDEMVAALRRGEELPPLAVRRDGLIEDGENRWRAYQAAGIKEVPVRRQVSADRMERAAEQGFDTSTPLYHGTSKDADFKKFKDSRHGTWTTTDPAEASMYAKDNDSKNLVMDWSTGKFKRVNDADRVLPLYAKPLENPYDVAASGYPDKLKNANNYKKAQSEWFDDLRRAGHDGVIMPGGVRVDFNNANLRGQFAQFDPKNAGKSMILGAGATDKRAASLAAVDDILDKERRLAAGASHEPKPAPEPAVSAGPAAAPNAPAVGPGGGGQAGARSVDEAQATAARWAGDRKPLEGIPGALKIGDDYFVPGPIAKVHDVAEGYMRTHRPEIAYKGADRYHPIDPEHSKAIAQAYEDMRHTPNDPATKASYAALIDETKKQYEAIKASGLKIEPIPAGTPDPYAMNPRLAAVDVAENNHLWFFPTEGGYGTEGIKGAGKGNPMLQKTGEKIGDHELLANDMFRVVHDYFGHLQHGHGFRAAGEDNAWRSHSAMYSDLARPAMTTETRGQNSWVNYGPHGDKNRTASGADTIYADQKVGLMPDWTMYNKGEAPPMMYHGSAADYTKPDLSKIGTGQGEMAYGAGYYGSKKEAVAKGYRDMQSDYALQRDGKPASLQGAYEEMADSLGIMGVTPGKSEHVAKVIADLMETGFSPTQIGKFIKEKAPAIVDSVEGMEKEFAAALKAVSKYKVDKTPGHMYKWALETEPEKLLDWDKPFNKQTSYVRERLGKDVEESVARQKAALERGIEKARGATASVRQRRDLEEMERKLRELNAETLSGREVYKRMGLPAADQAEAYTKASQRLKEKGIPALQYKDMTSSAGDGGARNFVVFDDSVLRLLRKYGVVGIPAAGVLGADGEERRAGGGAVNAALDIARRIKRAKGGGVHLGPITGDTGGRADKRPMEVPDGAYVLTADHVSGMGEGNTEAGMKRLSEMFPKSKPSIMRKMKGSTVPIYAADGEFVISPEDILDRYDDLDYGHRSLDAWQTQERQNLIETLQGLDPPAQD